MTARCIQLDSDGGLVVVNGGFVVLQGIEVIAQRIALRLHRVYGEWYLDQTKGVPYRERVLLKNPDLSAVGAVLRKEIVETSGVTGLRAFNLSLGSDRRLSVTFTAETVEGLVVAVPGGGPVEPWGFVLLFRDLGLVY